MNEHKLLERFFYEARRNAFLVSFFYFIGGMTGLGALTMLDPELGTVILILGGVWIVALTTVFLFLIHRMHQPLAEIKTITNEFFAGIMRDEELEITGAGVDTEKKVSEEPTQQVRGLKKEISRLKKSGPLPSVRTNDVFWRNLSLKYAFFMMILCVVVFILPSTQKEFFAVVGAIGFTAIALIHSRNKGRLKWHGEDK